MLEKQKKRHRRHKRIRAKLSGTVKVPRLSVFRSAKHIYAQLIDDEKGRVLAAASDLHMRKGKKSPPGRRAGKTERAREVGSLIAKKAKDLKIIRVVFDRAGYKYHGRVKTLAEAAREGGLKF